MPLSVPGVAALAAACLACAGARAGGVFCNSNQSAEYIGCLDRNSALDGADIAYSNMAGTVCLPPGLSLNLSNQVILQRAWVDTVGNPASPPGPWTLRPCAYFPNRVRK